ncbi:hypothetical protein OIU78_000338 [Salix suchowensis]|nr:hypothetical protein OIU78_000338 [Salix suchowensis]
MIWKIRVSPATLLAKALLDSIDKDRRSFGMELTHLMASMVSLGIRHISGAIICLTRNWRDLTTTHHHHQILSFLSS